MAIKWFALYLWIFVVSYESAECTPKKIQKLGVRKEFKGDCLAQLLVPSRNRCCATAAVHFLRHHPGTGRPLQYREILVSTRAHMAKFFTDYVRFAKSNSATVASR
jgi:hypothetical protein